MSETLIISLLGTFQALTVTFGVMGLKQYWKKQDAVKKFHDVAPSLEIIKNSQKRLDSIRVFLEMNGELRVSLWKFHNGGYYYSGEPIQKLSMCAESNSSLFDDMMFKFQNCPVHTFQRNIVELVDNDYCEEYNDLKFNDALSSFSIEQDTASSCLFRVRNHQNYMVGILMLRFHSHRKLTDEEIEFVKFCSSQLPSDLGIVTPASPKLTHA